jgi:predicted phosphodiesterase
VTVSHPELMSVGPTEAVVTFRSAAGTRVTTRVGVEERTTTGPRHCVRFDDLQPATEYELSVEGSDSTRWLPREFRTLERPPGRLRATIATANDVHFGETECGRTGDPATDAIGPILRAEPGEPPYPEVMNGAVVAEMRELDPDAVVVKGDLTDRGLAEQYADFLRVYGALAPRMHHVRGNHDALVDPHLAVEGAPYAVELDGVTLAVLDTTRPGAVGGVLPRDQLAWLDALASESGVPVMVFGHHPVWNPDAAHVDPRYVIALDDSQALCAVICKREAIAGYFAGHTHTNRVTWIEGTRDVPFVEVACTKDYPGAWAEYRVYDGGFTQVVRRVCEPAAFTWSERARNMIQGIYGELVLGSLADRCFSYCF